MKKTYDIYASGSANITAMDSAGLAEGITKGEIGNSGEFNWDFKRRDEQLKQATNEIVEVIESEGITPDANDDTQMNQAINQKVAKATAGVGNYQELELVAYKQAPLDGVLVEIPPCKTFSFFNKELDTITFENVNLTAKRVFIDKTDLIPKRPSNKINVQWDWSKIAVLDEFDQIIGTFVDNTLVKFKKRTDDFDMNENFVFGNTKSESQDLSVIRGNLTSRYGITFSGDISLVVDNELVAHFKNITSMKVFDEKNENKYIRTGFNISKFVYTSSTGGGSNNAKYTVSGDTLNFTMTGYSSANQALESVVIEKNTMNNIRVSKDILK